MRRLNHDRGSVAITVALSLTMLMGMAALAIDVGALLVEQRAVQTGADAAAIAIAKQCAEHAVDPSNPPCTTAPASTYLGENSTSSVTPTTALTTSYGGKVGRVAVIGAVDSQPLFARMLGMSAPVGVSAAATARWGPLTAIDDAFPLAACDGALPGPDSGQVTLVVDPAATGPPGLCDGADDANPFGWIPPDPASDCTAKITLAPSTYLAIGPADTPPTTSNCENQIADLLDAIASSTGLPEDRTRVLPIYDAAAGDSGSQPSVSLIAFEFDGVRIDDQEAHRGATEACPDGTHCIRGEVRDYIPPTDGPIFDPALAALLPNIDDTTVLDVRLVD